MSNVIALIFIALVIAGGVLYYWLLIRHVNKLLGKVEIVECDGYYRVRQFGRLSLTVFEQFYGGDLSNYKWLYVDKEGELTSSTNWATYTSLETAKNIAALAERHFKDFTEWKDKHPNRIDGNWKKVDL